MPGDFKTYIRHYYGKNHLFPYDFILILLKNLIKWEHAQPKDLFVTKAKKLYQKRQQCGLNVTKNQFLSKK